MGSLIDALLRWATRSGLRRGLAGEHWAWLVIGITAYALQRSRRPSEHVERLRLRPGDRYLVRLLPAGGRSDEDARGRPDASGVAGGTQDADGLSPAAG